MAFMKLLHLEPERGIVFVIYRLLHLCSGALLRLVITFMQLAVIVLFLKPPW